eukprot:GHVO01058118.1.p1 GENE.GHVO01058118.1~~GHVO01058118.1.p1  ORF type:complete len:141 (+),score=11.36 GHVO01058118.1:59-481(+)
MSAPEKNEESPKRFSVMDFFTLAENKRTWIAFIKAAIALAVFPAVTFHIAKKVLSANTTMSGIQMTSIACVCSLVVVNILMIIYAVYALMEEKRDYEEMRNSEAQALPPSRLISADSSLNIDQAMSTLRQRETIKSPPSS